MQSDYKASTLTPMAKRSNSEIVLDVLGQDQEPEALSIWHEFEQTHGVRHLACSHGWTSLWLKHYGPFQRHEFVVGKVDDSVIGIALVTQGDHQFNGPFEIQTYHLGTAGEPDAQSVCVEYNSVACVESMRSEFLNSLTDCIRAKGNWDRIQLDGFKRSELSSVEGINRREFTSHYYDLTKPREQNCEPLALLGKSTKKSIKRTRNAVGELKVDWAQDSVEGLDILEELIDLHQARWIAQGKPGVYSCERFTAFHRNAVCELVPTGQMALVRVTADGKTIGCGQYMIEENRLLFYQGGWADFGRNINPGMLFHYKCIEETLARGFDAYDFLKGGARYKTSLSTDSNTLVWASWERQSLKSTIVNLGRKTKAAIRALRRIRASS